MACARFQKKFLSWLDGDLSDNEKRMLEHHISNCTDCRILSEKFRSMWTPLHDRKRAIPSQFLWTNILERIKGKEEDRHPVLLAPLYRMRYSAAIAGIMMILCGILGGILLGSFPKSLKNDVQPDAIVSSGKYSELEILDNFDNFPPESLGKIYLMLTTDNEGGNRK